MKRFFVMLSLCMLFTSAAFSQKVTGKVLDEQSKGLAGASVILKKKSDSSVVKIGVTDKEGIFAFETIAAGSYIVNISFV
ncbi:MAG TPA: carboxypeptidase-like regulatory domain-containing protein, partial [Flavitalea sp.]|nr:carboxypeptidase-like regulatory domain-containing protein [Flavitalea sp.]